MINKIKNCPFCGKGAEIVTYKHVPVGTDYVIRCKDPSCMGRLTKRFTDLNFATRAWNRRERKEFMFESKTMLEDVRSKEKEKLIASLMEYDKTVIALGLAYAANLYYRGIDVSKKWETVAENIEALDKACLKAYYEGEKRAYERMKEEK